MSVRAAGVDDLDPVARIRKARFSHVDYLLGQYSRSLVAAFYRMYLTSAVFLVHTDGRGEVDAFVLGGEAAALSASKRQFVRAHALRIVWETLLRPRLWGTAVRGAWAMLAPAAHQAEKKVGDAAGEECAIALDCRRRRGGGNRRGRGPGPAVRRYAASILRWIRIDRS